MGEARVAMRFRLNRSPKPCGPGSSRHVSAALRTDGWGISPHFRLRLRGFGTRGHRLLGCVRPAGPRGVAAAGSQASGGFRCWFVRPRTGATERKRI